VTLDHVPPGSLKLVVATGDHAVADALRSVAREEDLRQISQSSWIVFSPAETTELRDALVAALPSGASIVVVEFERWSVAGDLVDPAWLLRRGH
jgi:hypothetical protein